MKNKTIGVIIMFFGLFSCSNKIQEMKIDTSEGFVDISLNITEIKVNDDYLLVTVENQYKKEKVGFQIEIFNQWKISQIENSNQSFYWGKGYFIISNENAKKYIEILSRLYSIEVKTIQENKIPVEIVGLANDPKLILTQPTKMKFFFNSNNEKLYSEVYINIDAKNKILEFHEKDEEYRQPLILSLCGEK
jgi:hypothetical protein